jgi:hypothetical protein
MARNGEASYIRAALFSSSVLPRRTCDTHSGMHVSPLPDGDVVDANDNRPDARSTDRNQELKLERRPVRHAAWICSRSHVRQEIATLSTLIATSIERRYNAPTGKRKSAKSYSNAFAGSPISTPGPVAHLKASVKDGSWPMPLPQRRHVFQGSIW